VSGLPDGPVLALDSSTLGGSVAVAIGGRMVVDERMEAVRGASSLLLPAVDAAVRRAGLAPRELAAVVVGGGPGSFTGLRIAAATAKAVVRALGVPLFAYSGLMGAAAALRGADRAVCALFDARNREVFAGCWRFGEGGVEEVLAPAALPVEIALAGVRGEMPVFTGDGAVLHRDLIEKVFGSGSVLEPADASPAAGLLWLARTVPARGRVAEPAAWEPEYLRAPGAERIAARTS
jgi:tRNA threonylcarbamoyladenosine biosynthesis protein TsaB